MKNSHHFPGRTGRIAITKDFIVISISLLMLNLWFFASTESLWAILAFPLLYGASLLTYAQLHRHYHAYSKSASLYNTIGIIYCAMAGLSWVLYCNHHANHHRFNNNQGDWSKTTDINGRPIIGWKYLMRDAWRPFMLQLIPFISLLGMKTSKRNLVALIDESSRVSLRLIVFLAFGVQGLAALLFWQLTFITTIIYLNYLQHFGIEDGYSAVWKHRFFNHITDQLGYHDQHHQYPSYKERLLPNIPSRFDGRDTTGLFSPKTMLFFLVSPDALAKHLVSQTQGR